MKRWTFLLGAIAISLPLTGCGSGMGGGSSALVPHSEDTNLPAEVREYEAKQEKRWADRAAKSPPAKAKKKETKGH